MTAVRQTPNRYLERPAPSSLADVIDTILDKGLVIDIYVRVSLVGIELLTIDARIVIASIDTYLRFAEAVNRLDLTETGPEGLPELMEDITRGGAKEQDRRRNRSCEGEGRRRLQPETTRTKMKTTMRMRTGPVEAVDGNLSRQRRVRQADVVNPGSRQ